MCRLNEVKSKDFHEIAVNLKEKNVFDSHTNHIFYIKLGFIWNFM